MSQRSGSTLTPSYGSGASTGSQRGGSHSTLSSYEVITNQYEGDTGFGMSEGRYPISETQPYSSNLPANVKLPPNYRPPHQPRTAPQPVMGMVPGVMPALNHPPGEQPATIPVSDIVKQLNFAASENLRLRERLQANNEILDRKLKDIQECLSKSDREKEELKKQASEATNQFFEARVAVLGYKCNVLQLQGELKSRKQAATAGGGGASSQIPSQPAAVSAQYLQQVEALQREKQELQRQLKSVAGPGAMKELQKQLHSVRSEKTAVDGERQNLMGVVSELSLDIQSLQDKRGLDQDELQRLSLRNQQMQLKIQDLGQANHQLREAMAYQQQGIGELSLAQSENESLKSQVHQLQQQLGVTAQEKAAFEKRAAELQQRSDILDRKLKERQPGPATPTSTPPVPKPRTNTMYVQQIERLTSDIHKLESEKQQMTAEIGSLQALVQKEQTSRTTAENLLNTANSKAQKLSQELVHLEQTQATPPVSEDQEFEVARLREEISDLQEQVQRYRHERDSANGRVNDLQRKCAELEREKADTPKELTFQSQREKDVARQEAEREKPASGQNWSEARLQKRLSDALGEIDTLKKERSRLQQIETVQSELQATVDQKERELADMKVEHPKELDKYRQELSQKQREISHLRQDIEAANQMHTQALAELDRVGAECRERQNSISQLKNEVEVRANERQSARSQCARLESEHTQLQTSYEDLISAHRQLQAQKTELQTQVQHLQTEVDDAQQAVDGYKQECAQTLQDYQDCAQELCGVREERDRQKKQADIGLRELTKRADRIKLLERQRNELQERIQHMEFQLKTYNSDFETERKSREDIVKTKVHADQKIQEQARDISHLQAELNSLSRQLAQQRLRGDESQFGMNQLDDLPGQLYQAPSVHRPISRERELLSSQRRSGEQGTPPYQYPAPPQVGGQDVFGGHQRSEELRRLSQDPIRARVQDPIPRARVETREPIPRAQIPAAPLPNWTTSSTHDPLLRSGSQGAELPREDRRMPFTDVVPPTGVMQPIPTGVATPHDIGQLRPSVGATGRNNLDLGTVPVALPQLDPTGTRYMAPGEIIDENPPAMACPLCGKADFKTQTDLELHSAQCTDGTL